MDCSLVFLVIFVALVTVAFAFVPLIWWISRLVQRLSAVERRLENLEIDKSSLRADLADMRRELAGLRGTGLVAAAEAAPAPGYSRTEEAAEEIPAHEAPPVGEAAPAAPEPSPEQAVPPTAPPPPGPPRPEENVPPANAAVPPPEAAEPQPEAAEPALRIDWERWVGVRGAAVVGAMVLGLAGFLFLKYSIEQDLIPPPVRVATGILAGLGCVVGSESLRRREHGYEATANALAGAGVVLLYGAVWAARTLYALIGSEPAFVLMVLVTLACGVLSWRYRSRVVAVLGLVGGFATPALLSTGQDRPIGLFGYLLLLNLGVMVLAIRRGWSFLAASSLGITTLYQAFWILDRMGPDRVLLGLAVVALFAVVYAAAGRRAAAAPDEAHPIWRPTQAAGVLVPFAFTFYFAGNADLGPRLYPLAALLLVLSLLARWIARQHGQPLFGVSAAAASVAAVLVWCVRTSFDTDTVPAWEGVISGVVLALAFHLFWELDVRRSAAAVRASPPDPPRGGRAVTAERVAAGGFLLLFVLVPLALREPSPWPWFAGWAALGALLWRQSLLPQGVYLPMLASLAVGTGAGAFYIAHGRHRPMPVLLFALAAAVACQLVAMRRRDPELRRWSEAAAAVLPLVLLLLLMNEASRPSLAPWAFYATTLSAAVLAALASTRIPSGGFYFAVMAALAFDHWLWSTAVSRSALGEDSGAVLLGFSAQALAALAFTVWPFAAGGAFRADPWAWYAAALAGPAWFLSLRRLFVLAFGDTAIGVLPVALAALSVAALARSRRMWKVDDVFGRNRLAWFAAVTLSFVSVAIPLQLDKEWITLGWALEGFAVLVLWKRLDHPGLKYFGLLLLGSAGVRLVMNPEVFGYYERSAWPVFNWLFYTYLVPAAALVLSARLLAPLEVERRRSWEAGLYARRWPVAAAACGVAAISVVFVWINLAIFDFFSVGDRLLISFDRLPARDLTMSLAWIAYALVLLGLGMARGVQPLRWISLAFLMLTLVKAFLYDLGELEDLYRVASLVALAVSLLAVSFFYQRFVFGRRPPPEKDS